MLTAQGISRLAVALLTRTLVLPMTVSRIPGQDFTGPNGATITVRVRQPRTAKVQNTPGASITYTDIDEVPVDVTVRHLYDATHLTDEDLALNLEDFGRQVLQPQVASVAIGAEDEVATVFNDLTADLEIAADGSDIEDQILAARETLGENDVPAGRRYLAVSPAVATFMLALDKFTRVDATGDPSALRDATLGRLYGFTIVESNGLTAGTAIAYHESAVAFGNRAPVPARGAESATATQGGIALRAIRMFDPDTLSEASVISTFAGASAIYENESGDEVKRWVKLETGSA